MFDSASFLLGLIFTVSGLALWASVSLILRRRQIHRQVKDAPATEPVRKEVESGGDASLVVQAGGKVVSLNAAARALFGVKADELPDFESMARRARPVEKFYQLCAEDGKARFALSGKAVEAESHQIPGQDSRLVTLRLSERAGLSTETAGVNPDTLQTFVELSQAMAASLDLNETLLAVLENVQKLVPADLWEINLLDAESECLVPYRLTGAADGTSQIEVAQERYSLSSGYSGYLASQRTGLLIPDVDARTDIRQTLDHDSFPLRSYLGVPLLVGKEFIGTLELGSLSRNAFQEGDLEMVRLVSGQAAIAVHNARLYQQEQRRTAELSGLAEVAQAFVSVQDPRGLFSRLVQSITSLLPVEIAGFLIYNDGARTLEGQAPFEGLPPQIIDEYRVPVAPGSAAEQILLSQAMIVSDNAATDSQWEALGLQFLAEAASMRETVLVPLSSGGRVLGYLQVSNLTNGAGGFSQDELHLLKIVANQAAPVIENASLVSQARQRVQRAEALRRITSLAGSAATLNEILQFSLVELVRLLQAHRAGVFLLDEDHTSLRLHRESIYGTPPDLTERQTMLKVDDPQFPFTITGGLHSLRSGNLLDEKTLIPFYQSMVLGWGLQSLIVVPLVVRDEGIGELWIGSQYKDYFDQGDVQMVATAAGTLAGVVEQSNLVAQTDEDLRRRVDQLTALTRITRELSTSLDLDYLLQLVYDEAVRTSGADCGTIEVFDQNTAPASEPITRFYLGDPLPGTRSEVERRVIESGELLHIPAVDASTPNLPHANIGSMLVVPVVYQERLTGLISLHARNPHHFDPTAIEVAQSLAAQAAVAFGNALQYEDQLKRSELLKRELETLSELFQVSRTLQTDQPLEDALDAVTRAIQQATPFQTVLVSAYESETDSLRRVYGAGIPSDAWEELRSHPQPWQALEALLKPEFCINSAYFIPADKMPIIPEEVHTVKVLPELKAKSASDWDPDDLLLLPLMDQHGSPLGMISVDNPKDGRRPDRATFEALELFANQAAVLIENQKHFSVLHSRLEQVESRAGKLEEVQADLPGLLSVNQAQTGEIGQLRQRVAELRSGLELAEQAGRQTDPRMVLKTVADELISRFGFQTAVTGINFGSGPQFLDSAGALPENTNLNALFGQRNPLRQVLTDGQLLIQADLEREPAGWQSSSLITALGARSFITLPFTIAAGQLGAVCAFSPQPIGGSKDENLYTFERLSRQVSMSLQNMSLLAETQVRLTEVNLLLDFTRKLGSLDPGKVLSTLLESLLDLLPGSQAGWVGLWNNASRQLEIQAAQGYPLSDSLVGIAVSAEHSPDALPLEVCASGQPIQLAEVNFGRAYPLPADDLLSYRKATAGRLPVSALIVPISRAEHVLGAVMLENFNASGSFSAADETLALSLAQQAGLALENARLFRSTEEHTAQLQALTVVASKLTSRLKTDELVASLLDQLRPVVPYETATLWLRSGDRLAIAAANGFEDNESRVGLSVAEQDSALFQEMIASGQAISVTDVRLDPRFPTALVEPENFSWLGIPLISKSELAGVIALEKHEPAYYTQDHIQVAVTFAGQAAISLENARLFEESHNRAAELDQRSQRLALLNQFSREVGASLEVDHILRLTATQLLTALHCTRLASVMLDDQGRAVLHSEMPEVDSHLPRILPPVPLFDRLRESLGMFNTPDVHSEAELAPLVECYLQDYGIQSLLIVPLVSTGVLQGWILLQNETENRFSPAELELARTLCNQAAIAMQNARLMAETRRLTEDLERRVEERTAELTLEHKNSQTLLQIITELSASLDVDQVLNRTLAVLNESTGAQQSLILLANGGKLFKAGDPLAVLGRTGYLGSPQPEKDLAQWVLRHKLPTLVDDISMDARWNFPPGTPLNYSSVMAVPLALGEDLLGTLLLLHHQPGFFQLEQVGLMEATARQISIALNNADLFNLIRDQAAHLGGMLRDQQIEASRSRAILEAVADGVVVTDANNHVTLFNSSAERMLELDASRVLDHALTEFPALFGKESANWAEYIARWASDKEEIHPGQSYAGQHTLENGRIVSVHLAPVIWRSDFLGTVSIFRDITHEVQVDRLKSEFVANVSHELRTPLTSIKGYVEIILMGAAGELNERQEHFLKIVLQNTGRLNVLLNDLLDISKIEAGGVDLIFQPVDLVDLIHDVVAELHKKQQDDNKLMHVEVSSATNLPPVLGDRQRLRQVLSSLVSNSYNYTPPNGAIRVRMQQLDGMVQVDVTDNGIGIGLVDQERIFERFYRGSDPLVLATAGTGLGLAISKILVEMHHGRIWFNSSGIRGQGSTFSFTLPVVKEEG